MKLNTSYLRKEKADLTKKLYKNNVQKLSNLKVKRVKNGIILPPLHFVNDNLIFGKGGVLDSKLNYCELSGTEGRLYGSYDTPKTKHINKTVVYCGMFAGHWGNFLLEWVSRLWYVFKEDLSVDYYVFTTRKNHYINSKNDIKGNYARFFKLLGIWDKLYFISEPCSFDTVIVPETSFAKKKFWSCEYKSIYEHVVNSALENIKLSDTWPKKVFLSRSKFAKPNNELGLDMIDNYFESNGFKILYPEKLELDSLIAYLQNAEVIASMSGSSAHNLLFAKDNSKAIIIERNAIINNWQVLINQMKQLDVTYTMQ